MGQALATIGRVIPAEGEPGCEVARLYYPEIREHEACRIPNCLTFEKKLDHDLTEYVTGVAQWAGIPLETIHNAINIDLPTKKAFYLMWELGAPAMEKMFVEKARQRMKDAQIAAQLEKKIIAPPKRGLVTAGR